jgi:DNA primase
VSHSIISDLLERVDVSDWLDDQGISYRRGGAGQFNLRECPWCGNSNSKVYMRADDGRGLCFRCQQGFNLWTFARQHLGTDNAGVARHFEDFGRSMGVRASRPALVTKIDGEWELPESIPLPTPEGETHPMLIARKITLATQSLFGLRWCPSGVFPYTDSFSGQKRSMSFAGRVLLPVCDLDGTMKTFQGRDATGVSEKRYLFPPSLPGTGRFLYGAHLVRGRSHLVVGEGPFDVMAIHQAVEGHPDFRNVGAIGSFGLSISAGDADADDQLKRFRVLREEGLQRVTMMWDGERRALAAAADAGMLLRRQGLQVDVALLPPGRDPNEVDTAVVRDAIINAAELTQASYINLRLSGPYS